MMPQVCVGLHSKRLLFLIIQYNMCMLVVYDHLCNGNSNTGKKVLAET